MSANDAAGLLYTLSRQLQEVRKRADDVANWPSPFHGIKANTFQDANATWLELLDGASNAENVPYAPLFVRARGLDVIVTLEVSADDVNVFPKYVLRRVLCQSNTYCWSHSSSSPITTARRLSTLLQSTHQQFPPIPATAEEFVSTGVNARPTFFGCDPKTPADYPMVIYLPNAPPINGDDPITKYARCVYETRY